MDWNKHHDNGILSSIIPFFSYGFIENTVNRCIYMKVSGSKFIILVLYVDDILLAANDIGLLHNVKRFYSKNFEMKDMSEASYVTWIEIFHNRS